MKIFISWSGEASRRIGGALANWLPQVLQAVKPYYTPSDIEKGDKWLSDILSNLDKSTIGIFCMTPENLDKPWIHFEAGALAGKVDNNKVCPLLFNVTKAEVTGPLKIFQQTEFQKDDFKQLIFTINKQLGEHKVVDQNLEKIFELLYPELEERIHAILNENITVEEQEAVKRSVQDMLEELLTINRNINSKLLEFAPQKYKVQIPEKEMYKLVDYKNKEERFIPIEESSYIFNIPAKRRFYVKSVKKTDIEDKNENLESDNNVDKVD